MNDSSETEIGNEKIVDKKLSSMWFSTFRSSAFIFGQKRKSKEMGELRRTQGQHENDLRT